MRGQFELRFKMLEIDGRKSISTDLPADEVRGIYAYVFTDGMWYVGKSIDVRKRHTDHMREYEHQDPSRIAPRPRQREAPEAPTRYEAASTVFTAPPSRGMRKRHSKYIRLELSGHRMR